MHMWLLIRSKCARVCVRVLVIVHNYEFVIEYVANYVNANVECMAVCFDMIKMICDYNTQVMTAGRG